jgi:membrane-bound lytic murein transglycosylase D
MPSETRNYLPKLQALKNIFGNAALLAELDLLTIPNRPFFATITQADNIDVKVAAKLAEMEVEDFVALNPAHNRPVIMADTPLVIPADKLDTFLNNLKARQSSNKPLSSWQSYTLRPGEKLEKVAQRFGMSVASLKSANGIKGRAAVRPGTTLLVAARDGGKTLDMAALPEQPNPPDPAARKAGSAGRSHSVRKGETLPMIARRYATSVAELKRANALRTDKIVAGTRLVVPAANQALSKNTPGKTDAAPVKQAKQDAQSPRITLYTIRLGDTLASIAKQFKVATADLMRWNRISPNALIPGRTLTIQLAQNP